MREDHEKVMIREDQVVRTQIAVVSLGLLYAIVQIKRKAKRPPVPPGYKEGTPYVRPDDQQNSPVIKR